MKLKYFFVLNLFFYNAHTSHLPVTRSAEQMAVYQELSDRLPVTRSAERMPVSQELPDYVSVIRSDEQMALYQELSDRFTSSHVLMRQRFRSDSRAIFI